MFTVVLLDDIESKIGVNPQDRTTLQIVFIGEEALREERLKTLGYTPVSISGALGVSKNITFEGKNYANEVAAICRLFPKAITINVEQNALANYVIDASFIQTMEERTHGQQDQDRFTRDNDEERKAGRIGTQGSFSKHDRDDDLSRKTDGLQRDRREKATGDGRRENEQPDDTIETGESGNISRDSRLHENGRQNVSNGHDSQRTDDVRDFTDVVKRKFNPIETRLAEISASNKLFVPTMWRDLEDIEVKVAELFERYTYGNLDEHEKKSALEQLYDLAEKLKNNLLASRLSNAEKLSALDNIREDRDPFRIVMYALPQPNEMISVTQTIISNTLESHDGEIVLDASRIDETDKNVIAGMQGFGNSSRYVLARLHKKMTDVGIEPSSAASALRTTNLTAMFTPLPMGDFVWDLVKQSGFDGGHVVELGCGTGRFVATMPEDLRKKTAYTGVEKDPISSAIAKALYPEQKIINEALENLPKNAIEPADAVVGNIPFGDVKIFDSDKGVSVNIHHYFMDRILDAVKPGGIVAIYNSVWVMEGVNPNRRKKIAQKADLLGMVRLDSDLIPNANMGAIDLLILKKREDILPDDAPDEAYPDWVMSPRDSDMAWGKTSFVSSKSIVDREVLLSPNKPFFVVLGDEVIESFVKLPSGNKTIYQGDYKSKSVAVQYLKEVAPVLGEVLNGQYEPKDIDDVKDIEPKKTLMLYTRNSGVGVGVGSIVKGDDGGYYLIDKKDGPTFIAETPIPVRSKKVAEQLDSLMELRQSVYEVISASSDPENSDKYVNQIISKASEQYERFVEKHGALNNLPAKHPIRFDIAWAVLSSCEVQVRNEHGVNEWLKSDFLKKRVISPPKPKDHYDSPREALLASYSETGMQYVEPTRVLDLLGEPVERMDEGQILTKFFTDLENDPHFPFFNPSTQKFEHPDFYLSGNVREKRNLIENIQEADPVLFEQLSLARNLSSLNKVVPNDLEWEDLDVPLGVPWVNQEIYKAFIIEVGFGIKQDSADSIEIASNIELQYDPENIGGWRLELSGATKIYEDGSQYKGGGKRFKDIFMSTMNGQKITIKRKMDDGTTILDEGDTATARERQESLEKAWVEWLIDNPTYRRKILTHYNNTYRSTLPYIPKTPINTIDGISSLIELRPHQKSVVTRALAQKSLLMAHGVGAGKTMAMIASIMACRNFGLVSRPMLVVKKSTIGQIATEAQKLFPTANILVMDSAKTTGKDKATFIGQLATGNHDFSIVTYETFKSIRFSPSEERLQLELEKLSLENALSALDGDESERPSFSQKRVMKRIEALDARLKKLTQNISDNIARSPVYYDDLGIDMLVFDEAHTLKNVTVASKENALSKNGSQIADDALLKVNWSRNKTPNFRLIFSTGTPISNSFSEMYGLLRFLDPDTLKSKFGGASHVGDSFFRTFTRSVSEIDMGVDGQYKERTRIDLINVPELASIFKSMADVVFVKDTNINRPDVEREHHVAPMTDLHQVFQCELINRAENIKERLVTPEEDNYLKLATNGRDMANDPRLLVPEAPEKPEYKIGIVVENVLDIYFDESQGVNKKTQAIFLDSGTPGSQSYDLYDLLKKKLVSGGISPDKIAFIHDAKTDAQREKLFDRVREGDIRIIIGSTEKMGVGVNMQTRLYALHHFDVPRSMRPSDVEQREGRILRQGNLNKRIKMLYYTTEGSFDVFTWNLVRKKQEMIEKIMSAHPDEIDRQIEDEGDVADYSTIVEATTGSTAIKELAQIERSLKNLKAKIAGRNKENQRMRIEVLTAERNIEVIKSQIESIDEAQENIKEHNGAHVVLFDDKGDVEQTFDSVEAFNEYLSYFRKEYFPQLRAKKDDLSEWKTFTVHRDLLVQGADVAMSVSSRFNEKPTMKFQCDVIDKNASQFWVIDNQITKYLSLDVKELLKSDLVRHQERIQTLSKNINLLEQQRDALQNEMASLEDKAEALQSEVSREIETFMVKQRELGATTLYDYVQKKYSRVSRLSDIANDVNDAIQSLEESEVTIQRRVGII